MKKMEILIKVLAVFGTLFFAVYGLIKNTVQYPPWVWYVAGIPCALAVILRIIEMIITYKRKKRT